MRVLQCRFGRLAAIAATVVGFSSAAAQANPGVQRVGRIVGVFDENGQPLEGAEVVDRISGGSLRTTRSGLIGMAAVASQHDSAVVTVRKIGFADTTVLVMVGARDTVPMQVFLRRAAALDEVVITAKETEHLPFYLRDFEERYTSAKVTGAKTFTPAEFRKSDGLHLYDLLFTKHVGGRTERCGRLLVYRDGVPWTPPEVEWRNRRRAAGGRRSFRRGRLLYHGTDARRVAAHDAGRQR